MTVQHVRDPRCLGDVVPRHPGVHRDSIEDSPLWKVLSFVSLTCASSNTVQTVSSIVCAACPKTAQFGLVFLPLNFDANLPFSSANCVEQHVVIDTNVFIACVIYY